MENRSLPESIGPYRVTGRLGRGGMGEVVRARDDRLDRPVAIKRVHPDTRDPETALRRFRREARAIARLSHPSIVQVHDWVESDGQHWLVMELVEGHSLADLITDGPLPPARCLEIGRDIAEGLAEAHEVGIVHRDLKASNVMITVKGRAKILDFGLAKSVPAQASRDDETASRPKWPSASLTGEGRVVGTVKAMSPEQAFGQRVDHRSDLFSLGILLYEISSGMSPFAGAGAGETLRQICSVAETPLNHVASDVSEEFSQLVGHLLEKDPPRRPQSARAVVEAIDRLSSSSFSGPSVEDPTVTPLGTTILDQAVSESSVAPSDERAAPLSRTPSLPVRYTLGILLIVAALASWGVPKWLGSSAPTSSISVADSMKLTPYERFQRGISLLESPELDEHIAKAIHEFQRALAENQEFAPALAGLSSAYFMDYVGGSQDPQRLEQALAAAEQAVDKNEHLAISWISLGQARYHSGQIDLGAKALERALEIEPANLKAMTALSEIREAQGALEEAEGLARQAAEADPGRAEFLGLFYFRRGRYEAAAEAFSRSLAENPKNFLNLRNLGVAYYMQGRLTEAAKEFQKALQISPDASLYSNIGTIYFAQGLYAQSATAFRKAIEEGGANDPMLWGNLGDARRWTPGHDEAARQAYTRAIVLLREGEETAWDPTTRSRLALYLAKRGSCQEAFKEIESLGDSVVEDGAVFFRVVVAREVCGDRTGALAALGKALEAGFSFDEVRRDPELLDLRRDVRFHDLFLVQPEPLAKS